MSEGDALCTRHTTAAASKRQTPAKDKKCGAERAEVFFSTAEKSTASRNSAFVSETGDNNARGKMRKPPPRRHRSATRGDPSESNPAARVSRFGPDATAKGVRAPGDARHWRQRVELRSERRTVFPLDTRDRPGTVTGPVHGA